MLHRSIASMAASATIVMTASSVFGSVVAPFSTDFSVDDGFVTSVTGTGDPSDPSFSLNTGATPSNLNLTIPSSSSAGSALIDVSNVPTDPGTGFSVSLDFTTNDVNGTVFYNAWLLSSIDDIGANGLGSGLDAYQIQLRNNGAGSAQFRVRRILADGSSVDGTNVNPFSGDDEIIDGSIVSLLITGVYDALGDLTITAEFTGDLDADPATAAVTATASLVDTDPLTSGSFFGFSANSGGGLLSIDNDIDFTGFSIVPEPASALLAGAGVLLLAARRRR